MRKVKRDKESGEMRCPKCGSTQFVGRRTMKGMVAGGLVFAPQRLKCIGCGRTLKSG